MVKLLRCAQVTESMRRDIHTKNEKIVALEISLESQKTRYEAELLAVRQRLEDNAGEHQLETQHMEANFQDQTESLTQKLKVHLTISVISLQARQYTVAENE